MELLRVDVGTDGVVALRGELDAETAPLLDGLVGRLPPDRRRQVLDLRELSFIDVTGARSLAAVARADPRRRFVLASTTPSVNRVLEALAEVLPPNLSVGRGRGIDDGPGALRRVVAALATTPGLASASAGIRSRMARWLRRSRRLRRRFARSLVAARRPRAPGSSAAPTR